MKQYTQSEFLKLVEKNGFYFNRCSGSHFIYTNNNGRHISIPRKLKSIIALRLIKENNLNIKDNE
jgi:predicted RNA binding protein YcfA (HicA-like mRNA interferase family)|nr:MAG TPA: putative RNA-binding protein [Crassvirales sp.]